MYPHVLCHSNALDFKIIFKTFILTDNSFRPTNFLNSEYQSRLHGQQVLLTRQSPGKRISLSSVRRLLIRAQQHRDCGDQTVAQHNTCG